jgi:mannan polymerase II complex MNN11 subunit
MHFALPPRKTSQPPPYARASRTPPRYRQRGLRFIGYIVCGLLTTFLLFRYVSFSSTLVEPVPPGTPPVVIVTVFDEQHMSDAYIQKVKTNREDYARRQGQDEPFVQLLRTFC